MSNLRICVLCETVCSFKGNNMMTVDKKRTFLGNPASQRGSHFLIFITF